MVCEELTGSAANQGPQPREEKAAGKRSADRPREPRVRGGGARPGDAASLAQPMDRDQVCKALSQGWVRLWAQSAAVRRLQEHRVRVHTGLRAETSEPFSWEVRKASWRHWGPDTEQRRSPSLTPKSSPQPGVPAPISPPRLAPAQPLRDPRRGGAFGCAQSPSGRQ